MAVIVDARGKACPQPVIDTRNAIQQQGTPVITVVDNEIARQNVEKMAQQMGLCAESSEVEGGWRILIQPLHTEVLSAVVGEGAEIPSFQQKKELTVVVLSSDCMGMGDETLGKALMKGFVYALTQLENLPNTVLLYNGGAKLSCEGADTVQDLQLLADNGTEVLTCGTCLNHYGLTEKLAVGSVTNMYVIAQTLTQADKVIRP